MLLAALDDSNLQSNPGTPVKPTPQQLNFDTPISSSIITSQSTPLSSSSVESTPKRGSVKSVELGTPILQTSSLYTKLPCSEKFSKDICDVINFENLPGATGSYEKISGILNKVRDVINKDNENWFNHFNISNKSSWAKLLTRVEQKLFCVYKEIVQKERIFDEFQISIH